MVQIQTQTQKQCEQQKNKCINLTITTAIGRIETDCGLSCCPSQDGESAFVYLLIVVAPIVCGYCLCCVLVLWRVFVWCPLNL